MSEDEKKWKKKFSSFLPILLVVSSLMMAINNLAVTARIVMNGNTVPLGNVIVFIACLAIWVFDSFLAQQPWRIAFLKHFLYSTSMFGLFIALFGAFLIALDFMGKSQTQVSFLVTFGLICAGAACYEGCRRLLNEK